MSAHSGQPRSWLAVGIMLIGFLVGGLALIPFAVEKRLAWYVFDLFDEEDPLRFWRYHQDPLEKRRPMPKHSQARPRTR